MAVGQYVICEPLRVWNRLEPRPRQSEFERVLRAEIADPIWAIARQWQFGELRGEDTGSPVLARVAARSATVESFRGANGTFTPYDPTTPLEPRAERQRFKPDLRLRSELGRRLLALADEAGAEHDAVGGALPYAPAAIRTVLRTGFGFDDLPDASAGTADERTLALRARSNAPALALAAVLRTRGIDGWAVLEALGTQPIAPANLPGTLVAGIAIEHLDLWMTALDRFRTWFESTHVRPDDSERTWRDTHLEYTFSVRLPRGDGGVQTLHAPEYHGGRLDWYAFEAGGAVSGSGPDPRPQDVATMIPVGVEYPGMPHRRLWQMEDGAVDLGDLRADTTDVVKVLVAEFALLFGNDWFMFPMAHRYGSLVEVEGVVVTDVFGERTFVEPAVKNEGTSWSRWSFFELTGARAEGFGPHLFLPPAVTSSQESAPLESVTLLRDESANMVWGIEQIVPDGRGGGRSGPDAARAFERLVREVSPLPPPGDPAIDAELVYRLGSTVEEHWIPFIAVHREADGRSVQLQRAAMPRFAFEAARPIRPQTDILRFGIDASDQQTAPLFLNEEEVPRGGVRVETTVQRTRCADGRALVWIGRRKRSGRGEGSSSLAFDVLTPKEPPPGG